MEQVTITDMCEKVKNWLERHNVTIELEEVRSEFSSLPAYRHFPIYKVRFTIKSDVYDFETGWDFGGSIVDFENNEKPQLRDIVYSIMNDAITEWDERAYFWSERINSLSGDELIKKMKETTKLVEYYEELDKFPHWFDLYNRFYKDY